MQEDIYYPAEIKEEPMGDYEGGGSDNINKTYNTEVYTPAVEVDRNFPPSRISYDLISRTLDSRTKKIKAEYSFSKEGALLIGGYVNGVSGEVAISPDGIIAKNVNGETTVLIEGTTGDAYFKGTVQTGSVIAGRVTVTGRFVVNDGSNERVWLGDLTP